MKLIAKTYIVSGKGTVKTGTAFDSKEHGIEDDEAEVLIARGFCAADESAPEEPTKAGKSKKDDGK